MHSIESKQKEIIELVSNFTMGLVKTGLCIWDNIPGTNPDPGSIHNESADQEILIVLQYSHDVIERFIEGVKFKQPKLEKQFVEDNIIKQSEIVRITLQEYATIANININVELWIAELSDNLSNLSGFVQNYS